MKKIAVLISGSGSNLEAIIKACTSKKIEGTVESVICNDPRAYGIERAKSFNIDVRIINHKDFSNREDFDNELENYLMRCSPDLIVLAGFMRILGEKIISTFNGKIINLHPSILPLYPGLNTHDRVLQNNDISHGITIHYVSGELDAGPIIAQGLIEVKANESKDSLIERIHKVEHILLPEIINEICIGNILLQDNIVVYKNSSTIENGIISKFYEL